MERKDVGLFSLPGREAAPVEPADQVTAAAGRLELSECDLFFLAYRQWFGRAPEATALERVFGAYMVRQEVPHWVRHYAREALAPRGIGRAEARRLGLDCPSLDRLAGPPPAPRHGRLVVAATGVAATGAVFLGLFVLLLDTAYDPASSARLSSDTWRPSCAGGGPGLVWAEEVAYAFAGRTPPKC